MTSTEIAIRDNASVAVTERDVVDGWITVLGDVGNLADYIAETDFVPRALRNRPAAVAACILTGRELGIGPMASLKSIHMVQGVPSLSAEYKRARAMAAGHEIVVDETNATRCVVRGRRAGTERWVTITWTIDMARRAKIAGKDVWQQYPQRMLQARATSELCDLLFPDATLGLETTEVLEDGGALAIAEGVVVEEAASTPAIEPPKPDKPRTAQRKQRTQDASPAHAAPAAPAATPPAQGAGEALPPLPGEEEERPTGAPAAGATAPTGARANAASAPPSSARHPAPEDGSTSASSPASASAAASGSPDDADYDTPGTVTRPQLTAIWTVLSNVYKFSSDEKDQARSICAHIASRPLESSSELSKNEGKAVLDTLSHWRELAEKNGMEPRAFLVSLMAEAAGGEATDGQ